MARLPFDRNINPFVALLIITVVGSGAALTLMKIMPTTELLTMNASALFSEMQL